jgi:hypothetical protein
MDTNKVKKLAKDFAKDFPRSPREKLGGYVIAARTLAPLGNARPDPGIYGRIRPAFCASGAQTPHRLFL